MNSTHRSCVERYYEKTVSIIGGSDQKEGTALTIFRKRDNRLEQFSYQLIRAL
jgi:hypothetical protein